MNRLNNCNVGCHMIKHQFIKIGSSASEKQVIESLTKFLKNIDDMTINELKNHVKELEEYKNKDGKIIQDWKNGKTHHEIYKEYGSFGLYLIFLELKKDGVEPKEFSEFLKILIKMD